MDHINRKKCEKFMRSQDYGSELKASFTFSLKWPCVSPYGTQYLKVASPKVRVKIGSFYRFRVVTLERLLLSAHSSCSHAVILFIPPLL